MVGVWWVNTEEATSCQLPGRFLLCGGQLMNMEEGMSEMIGTYIPGKSLLLRVTRCIELKHDSRQAREHRLRGNTGAAARMHA